MSALGAFAVFGHSAAAGAPRERLTADFGWRFLKGDVINAAAADFNDAGWRTVNLPHDWSIEGPFDQNEPAGGNGGYLPTGIGWYRRAFVAPESWRGRKVAVEFDGVYMRSDVWLNGRHLGLRPFGYIGFEYDLTTNLSFGATNVLAVRVDNSRQPNSRWYSGSGIYRHVWFNVSGPLQIAHWGTCVTTPQISSNSATIRMRTRVENGNPGGRAVSLQSEILDPQGRAVAVANSDATLAAGRAIDFDQTVNVTGPSLWSVDSPTLYRLRSTVKSGDEVVDETETPFGIREIRYDVDRGFFLNGQHVKMQGLCLHHDGGSVGAAVPEAVWERRLRTLKEMGCNAIRMSHNPPAPELLDLCDRLGFLVMDEAFDEWRRGKVRQGYATFFDEWSQRDLSDMLQRDRNHPSIVLWSVGNEIPEQTRANGADVLRPLVETCHREDPTRPVTSACDNIYTDGAVTTQDFLNLLDVVGYNYVDRWGGRRETFYADDRHQFPQRKMIGTENVCIGGVRSGYEFGASTAGGFPRPGYAASMVRAEQLWKFTRVHDYVIGDFLWTGIDYLGEARWPSKQSRSGVLDTCGFPKDSYYFYESQWTTNLMVHLFPHWNWKGREGQVIPVVCYTSCDTVELFLNGRSFGAKSIEFPRQGTAGGWNSYARPLVFPTTGDLHLSWDVPYEPGVLKAVGYKNHQKVCEEEIRTTGEPARIVISPDRGRLQADGRDVAQLTVTIVDAQGDVVPVAQNEISFAVEGAGTLIGLDNGDPTSHEDYKATQRKAFGGLCLAIVQAGREAGQLRVSAQSPGLEPAATELTVEAPPSSASVLP